PRVGSEGSHLLVQCATVPHPPPSHTGALSIYKQILMSYWKGNETCAGFALRRSHPVCLFRPLPTPPRYMPPTGDIDIPDYNPLEHDEQAYRDCCYRIMACQAPQSLHLPAKLSTGRYLPVRVTICSAESSISYSLRTESSKRSNTAYSMPMSLAFLNSLKFQFVQKYACSPRDLANMVLPIRVGP
ncbi:12542_t:CDS:2, partial [Acaulospora colombiana]